MKKLSILFLMLVLSMIVFTGCNGLLPSEGEGESESELITSPCPTINITGEQTIDGKTYIKGDTPQTITITFNEPTEPVSAFIADALGKNPNSVPDDAEEVILYTEDKITYTGTYTFSGNCTEGYIYVVTCDSCMPCKYPYKVDDTPPYASIEICIDDCTCEGCTLNFTSTVTDGGCTADTVNCGDDCSGLASWSIDLYEEYPFDDCCVTPCEEPIFTSSGESCPIECNTDCLTLNNQETYYLIVNLTDQVGNHTRWGTMIAYDTEQCEAISIYHLSPNECLDDPMINNSGFVVCEELMARYLSLSVDPSGGGTATDQTGTSPYILNEQVDILAVPNAGYEFVNWTTPSGTYDANFADANDPSTTFTIPAEYSTEVTAHFKLNGGTLNGQVKDASTGIGIPGATVEIAALSVSTTTNASGNYTIADIPEGNYTVKASHTGYVDEEINNVAILTGVITTQDFALSPDLIPGEMRIVLTWGENPNDLDTHLKTPEGHIYWANTTDGNATLDVDDISGYGPETITYDTITSGTHYYYIHDWHWGGSDTLATSNAVVKVYDDTGLIETFNVPTTSCGTGWYWKVFTMDGATKVITPVNELVETIASPWI